MDQSINPNLHVIGDEIADFCVRIASLKGITMQPLRAHNLEEAIGVIGSIPVDLYGVILTNNTLGRDDIRNLVEMLQLRKQGIIIVLSGDLDDTMCSDLMQLGVKSVLKAPLNGSDLYQAIMDALEAYTRSADRFDFMEKNTP